MGRFEVDSARVAQAASAAGASVGALRTETAALMRHLTDLQGSWTGQAAAAFADVLADWSLTQVRVEQSLDGITAALGSAAQAYADAEQQATRMFLR